MSQLARDSYLIDAITDSKTQILLYNIFMMNGLKLFFWEENDLNPHISTHKKKWYTIKKNLTIEKIFFFFDSLKRLDSYACVYI